MFGVLNVNKPAGSTSRDVVNRIQRLVRPHKAGHAGTLDPLATGVLVVAIGRATRLIEYVQRMPKQYHAEFILGKESDTEDIAGDVRDLADAPRPEREAVESILPRFIGDIEQTPPVYSPLKVAGRRSYDLARQGQAVELKPRRVTVHQVQLLAYDYPTFELDVRCGSGTYIRSLGRDIARALGTGAVMSALRRTAIGGFTVDQAVELDDLTADNIHSHLLPATTAVAALPSITFSDTEKSNLLLGRQIQKRVIADGQQIAAIDQNGELIGILEQRADDRLKPIRNFPS